MKNKIIIISGFGRSGSTVFEAYFSKSINALSLGEVNFLWERGVVQNSTCSCGMLFNECHSWKKIFTKDGYFFDSIFLNNFMKNKYRIRYMPIYFANTIKKNEVFIKNLNNFFEQVSFSNSDKNIFLDSSKIPLHAFFLKSLDDQFDVYVIHIVRDPRGVIFSWNKKKKYEIKNDIYMNKIGILKASILWIIYNYYCEKLKKIYDRRYFFVKYEDFSKDPEKTIAEIEKYFSIQHEYNQNYELHSVSGNPVRFNFNSFEINLDEEWKTKMGFLKKLLVSFICFPYFIKYKYKL